MSSLFDIWDVEKAVDTAAEYALNNQGMQANVYTLQDAQPFQKARGRCEVLSRKGAGTGHLVMPETSTLVETYVEDCWEFELNVFAITADDMVAHGQYRAYVRYVMSILPQLINTGAPPGLLYHDIFDPIRSAGDSPIMRPQKGVYQTHMVFNTKVGVNQAAWAAYVAPQLPPQP